MSSNATWEGVVLVNFWV